MSFLLEAYEKRKIRCKSTLKNIYLIAICRKKNSVTFMEMLAFSAFLLWVC